jgi:pectate lyase
MSPSAATIAPGVKLQLRALYDPDGAGGEGPREVSLDASWATSNSDVADVDQRGEVEGRSFGTAVVTAEYLDASATAIITVSASATATPSSPQAATTTVQPNDRIHTTASVDVRCTPSASGILLGTQPDGSHGTIIDGPIAADGFIWWRVDYDDGPDGWSVEDFLALTPARYEGFGGQTPGGEGKPLYRVTTLADSGAGSLRDAISQGDRHVVFDVAGEIVARNALQIRGGFLTIDGFSAPEPGITITNRGLQLRGTLGAHDIIVRGLRVRNANASASTDCIQVSHGAFNIVLDHVSVSGCADGGIDVTGDPNNLAAPPTRDVTVSWSILGPPLSKKRGMLIKYGTTRISLHHNLFVNTESRLPEATREGLSADDDTTLDMRNNVIWNWGPGSGTRIHAGVNANVVANLYGNPGGGASDDRQGLIICRGDGVETAASVSLCNNGASTERAHGFASGNVSADGVDLDAMSNVGAAFPASAVTTTDACTAARQVLASAGAPFRDETDGGLTDIDLPCSP